MNMHIHIFGAAGAVVRKVGGAGVKLPLSSSNAEQFGRHSTFFRLSVVIIMLRTPLFASLLVLATLLVVTTSAQHAHCSFKVSWPSTDCSSAFSYLVDQVSHFNNPSVRESNYTLISSSASALTIHSTHTSPVHRYIDDQHMSLAPSTSGTGCDMDAKSESRPISIYDYSTNFCDVYNLLRAGPAFSYDVSTLECPFHPKRGAEDSTCNQY